MCCMWWLQWSATSAAHLLVCEVVSHQQRVLADLAQVREDVVDALAAELADHLRRLILALGLDVGAAAVVQGPNNVQLTTALAGGARCGAACVGSVLSITVVTCQLAAAPAASTQGSWTCTTMQQHTHDGSALDLRFK